MPKGRRVRRVVRKIDTWTVLRLAFIFWLCVALITLFAGVLLWALAGSLNAFGSISKFLESLGILDFRFHGFVIFRAAAVISGVLVLFATGATVLLAVLYNLISDVVGGVEFIVLEEEEPADAAPPLRAAIEPVVTSLPGALAPEVVAASSKADEGFATDVAMG